MEDAEANDRGTGQAANAVPTRVKRGEQLITGGDVKPGAKAAGGVQLVTSP
jgi:hypothetical protein